MIHIVGKQKLFLLPDINALIILRRSQQPRNGVAERHMKVAVDFSPRHIAVRTRRGATIEPLELSRDHVMEKLVDFMLVIDFTREKARVP